MTRATTRHSHTHTHWYTHTHTHTRLGTLAAMLNGKNLNLGWNLPGKATTATATPTLAPFTFHLAPIAPFLPSPLCSCLGSPWMCNVFYLSVLAAQHERETGAEEHDIAMLCQLTHWRTDPAQWVTVGRDCEEDIKKAHYSSQVNFVALWV